MAEEVGSMRSYLFWKNIGNFGDGTNMADWEENFSSLDLGEDETVLAIRLAEALRTDEVETFLEIYDSIPSTTETKRVSILITTLLFLFLKSSARLEKLKLCKFDCPVFSFAFVYSHFGKRKRPFTVYRKWSWASESLHSLRGCHVNNPNKFFCPYAFAAKCWVTEIVDLVSKSVGTHSVDRLPGGKIYAILDMWPSFGWDIMQSLKYLLSIHVPQFRNVDAKVTQGLVRKTNKFDILYRKRSIVAS